MIFQPSYPTRRTSRQIYNARKLLAENAAGIILYIHRVPFPIAYNILCQFYRTDSLDATAREAGSAMSNSRRGQGHYLAIIHVTFSSTYSHNIYLHLCI